MAKRYYKCEETHQTVNGVKLKCCTKCKRWKEINEFCKDRARKDGLRIYCKSCNNAYVLKHQRKNKKAVREYLRYEERHRVIRGLKEKLCSSCKKWRYYSDFSKNRRSKDGLSFRCKECERKRTSHKRKSSVRYLSYEDRHRIVDGIRQKFCRKCGKWKAEDEFYKNKSNGDGLDSQCRECLYKTARKSHKSKRKSTRRNLKFEERHRVVKGVRQKYCRKCKRWKKEGEFYKDGSKRDGLHNWCQKCSRQAAKEV